jgi:glutamate synthase domain-containing protein 3
MLPSTVIDVPDIRDYQRINAELAQLLDQGTRHIRLIGVEKQRLLLARVRGPWNALIEIDGNAGPELAAELDAPGLVVVCHGSAADGAGRGLIDGRLLILGDAGAGAGISQHGGSIVVAGASAERAGLNQSGGSLTLLGEVGTLTGERQAGGTLFVQNARDAKHLGRSRRGGRFVALDQPIDENESRLASEILQPFQSWLIPDRFVGSPIQTILEGLGSAENQRARD